MQQSRRVNNSGKEFRVEGEDTNFMGGGKDKHGGSVLRQVREDTVMVTWYIYLFRHKPVSHCSFKAPKGGGHPDNRALYKRAHLRVGWFCQPIVGFTTGQPPGILG